MDEEEAASFETAFIGWLGIAFLVIGYDAWALITKKQTLSSAFWHTQRTSAGRLLVGLGWGSLTWHLVMGDRQILPDKWNARYKRIHPLWRGRDLLLRKRKAADIVLSGGQ